MIYDLNVSVYLSIMWIFLAGITTYIMYYYPNHKNFLYYVYPTIWLEYFCAFGILLLVPLDLAITIIGRKHPNYYYSNINIIVDMYLSLYWPTLVLSNIILVFQEMYNASGYFKVIDKLKGIIHDTCYQIITGIIFCAIFFGILVGENIIKPNMNAVLLSTIIITNTIWLTFLMILLGYGFIIFPIRMYEYSSYYTQLDTIQHNASYLYENMKNDSIDISICVADILKTNDFLQKSKKFGTEISELMSLLPDGFTAKGAGHVAMDKKENKITLRSLAELKQNLYNKKQKYTITKRKVKELEKKAWALEDIINTIENNSTEIYWTVEPKYKINKKIEHYYYTKVHHILCKFLSVLFFICSLFSFLGVFGSISGMPSETSVYFIILHNSNLNGIDIVIFTLLTLGYTFYVAMWALYEIKITGIMELVGNNGTWPISMSFHARMVARLVAPLIFFYLGLIRENQNIGGNFEKNINGLPIYTAFSKFYQIQVVPILGNSFSTFFPILILSVSFLTVTNILNRLLVMIKLEKWQFGKTFISEDVLIDGKKQLEEKKQIYLSKQQREIFSNKVKKIQTTTKNPLILKETNITNNDHIDLEVGETLYMKSLKNKYYKQIKK